MAGIQELEAELNGASRENRFAVEFTLPAGVGGDTRKLNLLVKSASVPGKTRGVIELKKDGKTARIAGDEMTNDSFSCTVSVPKDSKVIYKTMDDWFQVPDTIDDYKVEMSVSQLDIQNEVSQKWILQGVWITTLPEVTFDRDSQDTLKEFDVTFSVDRILAQ